MLVAPDHDATRSGKRIRVYPSPERGFYDSLDKIICREKDGGCLWIRNDPEHPDMSPVIPLLLGLAAPVGDVLPSIVRMPRDRWEQCMNIWVFGEGHKKAREMLANMTGFRVWRDRANLGTAMQRTSGLVNLALRCWSLDAWAWDQQELQ